MKDKGEKYKNAENLDSQTSALISAMRDRLNIEIASGAMEVLLSDPNTASVIYDVSRLNRANAGGYNYGDNYYRLQGTTYTQGTHYAMFIHCVRNLAKQNPKIRIIETGEDRISKIEIIK